MKPYRSYYIYAILYTVFFLFVSHPAQAAPIINQVSTNLNTYPNSQVPLYDKLEITFQIQNSVASSLFFPFDAQPPPGIPPNSGITVNTIFTDPQGNTFIQPAFYYQDFLDEVKNNQEWFYPIGTFLWKTRFAPNKTGEWNYRLTVTDASGTTISLTNTFSVVNSSNHGFIKVSPDTRYFEYDDGTYFPALGFNLNGGELDNINPTLGNESEFVAMGANGIELSRVWITQFSIYGEAYGKWNSPNRVHQTQEPRMGIVNPVSNQFTRYPSLTPPPLPTGSEYYMWLNFDETTEVSGDQLYFTPCRSIYPIPVKQNTQYRLRVRYKDVGLEGPKVTGQPFGFAVKSSSTNLGFPTGLCNETTSGTVLAATYQPNAVQLDPDNPGWMLLEKNFTSGPTDFLPYLFLTFDNVRSTDTDLQAGHIFIDNIWLEEDACPPSSVCANLIHKPWMSMHQYVNQRDAYAFDKVLTLAKTHNLYLKAVMLEKNDRIFQTIDYSGQPTTNQSVENFYGNSRSLTKSRWLQQAWWRYMQARWGYSPNIHSWELLNEGSASTNHLALADEFGKYMKCRVFGITVSSVNPYQDCQYDHPNNHLVSTSFSGGQFLWRFWNNQENGLPSVYADIDYADKHMYAHRTGSEHTPGYFDSALYTWEQSMAQGQFTPSTRKPFIRGEVAWDFDGDPNLLESNADGGVWLHDFIWGGINPGGLMEHFFAGGHFTDQLYNLDTNPPYDHRHMFKPFYDFIKNVPLNNGKYADASASASISTVRAWGQKDTENKRAHLWVSNSRHIWCAVVPQTVVGCPQTKWTLLSAAQKRLSGTVTVGGFAPNTSLPVQLWNFDEFSNLLTSISISVTTNPSGIISLNLSDPNLFSDTVVDAGIKIGDYSETTPSPSPTPTFIELLTNWLTTAFDQNGDGKVNSLDFASLLL